ncbi:hypothetical protein HPP92_016070 [Vanilla planifolia]|uniref:Style cell-cycle inhibitor 1-A n=1 Tax=Vanilla planifolia TaxID=51239 RepID=A0A835QKT9_VANPL|nr:hypothetical protein HPP92_016070 [Vanilla planifolia]
MGDRKSRKRRSLTPSSDDVEEKAKKHRNAGEKGGRASKEDCRERKKKKRDDKSHKHSSSRREKERKSKEKHNHSKTASNLGMVDLSDGDYFSKNNEFSTWLKEERGIYFSDLSSEAARELFSSFIKAWNSHKLQPRYYEGIASAPRTSHNWKIKH